jgi:hypothetical protein
MEATGCDCDSRVLCERLGSERRCWIRQQGGSKRDRPQDTHDELLLIALIKGCDARLSKGYQLAYFMASRYRFLDRRMHILESCREHVKNKIEFQPIHASQRLIGGFRDDPFVAI